MKSQGTQPTITLLEGTQKALYQYVYLMNSRIHVSGTNYGSSDLANFIKKMSSFDTFYKAVQNSLKSTNPMVNFFVTISKMKLREIESLKRKMISEQPQKSIYLQIIDKYKNPEVVSGDRTLLSYMQEILNFRVNPSITEANHDTLNAITLISEILKLLVEFRIEPVMLLPDTFLSDLIGNNAKVMFDSISPETLEMLSGRYLADEDINQQGLGYLFNTNSSLIIGFLERNPEYLNEHLYAILTRAIQFENISLIEFITSKIPEAQSITEQNYLDIFQNILNAFARGNKDVCKFFLESKLWSYLNSNEHTLLIRTLVIRAEQSTLNNLMELMIEKKIFTTRIFTEIADNFPLPRIPESVLGTSLTYETSEAYKVEICRKLEPYQETILLDLFQVINDFKQGSNSQDVVRQIIGIASYTKYFSKVHFKKVVKINYENLAEYIGALEKEVKYLKSNNNPAVRYVELLLRYLTEAEQETKKAITSPEEVENSWTVDLKLHVTKAAKAAPKKSKNKKAPLQIAEVKKASEEQVSVVDNDHKPDDGDEKPGSLSEDHRDIIAEEADSIPKAERKSYLDALSASLKQDELKVPIIAPVIANSDEKPKEPEAIISSSSEDDHPDDDADGSLVVQSVVSNSATTDLVKEIVEEIVEASTAELEQKERVIIGDDQKEQVEVDISFGSFGLADDEIPEAGGAAGAAILHSALQHPDGAALRFGNISPISSHEDEESDDEANIIIVRPSVKDEGNNDEDRVTIPQAPEENMEKHLEGKSSVISTKSTYVSISKVAAPGNIYLGYAPTKTQWLNTDTGKLIYHILISNYDQSLTSLYINPSNPAEALTQEEYRTLKPSEMSTEKSVVHIYNNMYGFPFYAVYVYNNVQLVLSYTIMPYQMSDGYGVQWQIGNVINYAGSSQLANSSMAQQQTEAQSEDDDGEQGTESSGGVDKAKTHSEQGGSTNTNLSDSSQSTNSSAILSAFKENDYERKIEFTVTLEINKDKEDLIENEEAKQYREHKEEAEKNLEDQSVKFIVDESYGDKVNTSALSLGIFDEKLFKPFLGEHDHPAFKFAGSTSM